MRVPVYSAVIIEFLCLNKQFERFLAMRWIPIELYHTEGKEEQRKRGGDFFLVARLLQISHPQIGVKLDDLCGG